MARNKTLPFSTKEMAIFVKFQAISLLKIWYAVALCMREGLDLVKFFPAGVMGGVSMLKSLAGPYPAMKFMPTGGVNLNNVREYLSLKNVVACGGTWIVPIDMLSGERFEEIEELAREASNLRAAN